MARPPLRPARLLAGLLLLMLAAIGAAHRAEPLVKHPGDYVSAIAKVAADGSFTISVRFDLLAFATEQNPHGSTPGPQETILDAAEPEMRARLVEAETRMRTGIDAGTPLRTVRFPDVTALVAARDRPAGRRLPVIGNAVFAGKLPTNLRTIAFRFPETLDVVILTTEFPYQEPISDPVNPGERSRALTIPTEAQIAAAARAMGVMPDGRTKNPTPRAPTPTTASEAPSAMVPSHSSTPKATKAEAPTRVAPSAPRVQKTEPQSVAGTPQISPKDKPVTQVDAGEQTKPNVAVPPIASTSTPPPAPPVAPVTHEPTPAPSNVMNEAVTSENAMDVTSTVGTSAVNPPRNPLENLPRYVRMGFLHILPEGVDHIVFVLGLVLVAVRTKDLLSQVSAFTVAHSLTLGLALFGVVRLPERIVEPLIAISIAFVAIENIAAKRVGKWRLAAVFGFGLIHGLGFAGALQEMGLARRDLLPALVGFNIGVELGQLAVVAMALGILGSFRGHENYRKYVVIPASLLIAVVALFWTAQRVMS